MSAPSVTVFLGPCFVLACISFTCFGISCAQAYSYWRTYRLDPTFLRYTVLLTFITETLHTSMILHFTYNYAVIASSLLDLDRIVWSGIAVISVGIVIAFLTQGFYIWRIYQLSNRNLMATMAPALSLLMRCGLATATVVLGWRRGRWSLVEADHTLHIILTLSLSMNVTTDLLLAAIFTYYLRKRKTAFMQTQNIVDALMVYAASTEAIAAVASLVVIVLYLTIKTLAFTGMYMLVGKIYANSMLAQLNTRQRRDKCSVCDGVQEIHLSRIVGSDQGSNSVGQSHMGIHMDVVKQSYTSD